MWREINKGIVLYQTEFRFALKMCLSRKPTPTAWMLLYTLICVPPLQVCRAPWWSRLDSLWWLPSALQCGGGQTDAWSLQGKKKVSLQVNTVMKVRFCKFLRVNKCGRQDLRNTHRRNLQASWRNFSLTLSDVEFLHVFTATDRAGFSFKNKTIKNLEHILCA